MQFLSLRNSLLLVLIFFMGCSSLKKNNENIPIPKPTFSPGTCLIIGEIVSIDSTRLSKDSTSPCSQNPCWATVKIDSVIECGAGASVIGKNDLLKTNFTFTLAETTEKLFPNLEEKMPGLAVNSKFKATIKKRNTFNSKNKTEYQINTYKRISK